MRRLGSINVIILLIGFVLSFATSQVLYQRHVSNIKLEFERTAHERIMAIQRSIESSVLAAKSTAGFISASHSVSHKQFSEYAKVLLADTPYIKAVEWIPRIRNVDREGFETKAREIYPNFQITERNDQGQLVKAGQRDVYFPVFYLEPYKGNEKAIGFDLASHPVRRAALDYAKVNNVPSTTGRISLVQGSAGQWGFLMYSPVFKQTASLITVAQQRPSLAGLVVIVFDISSMVDTSLSYLRPAGIHFSIHDKSADPEQQLLHFHQTRTQIDANNKSIKYSAGPEELSYIDSFSVNNRSWSIEFFPAQGYFTTGLRFADVLTFIVGVLITLLLFAYFQLLRKREYNLRSDKGLLEDMVSQRTKDLEEKNKQLEAYSYSIAHDLRSPLRSITSFSQILTDEAGDKLNNEEKDHLSRIVSAGKYMAEIIDDILEISRVMSTKLARQNVNMSEVAHDISRRLDACDKSGHNVNWIIEEDVTEKADPQLVRLLLENLIGNAYKFSALKTEPQIEFGVINKNKGKFYFVRDNGVGFEMKYSEKIFGLFQRLHKKDEYEGTGIGLATVQRIVERHGGKVWVESELNQGATFYFSLA